MRLTRLTLLAVVLVLGKADESGCDVLYDGHCLVGLLTARFNDGHGRLACEEIGGKLANIYNEEEMTMIEDFLRTNEMDELLRLDLRTGMKYKHGHLLNNDGSLSTATLKWAPNWPQDHRGWHDVILTVVHHWNIPGVPNPEGLTNKPGFNRYFMLCEIP